MTDLFLSTIKDLVNQQAGYSSDKHTHSSICTIAANWIIRNYKCRAVLVERGCGEGEMPDVLGFYYNDSVLIEAKISRSDFLADQKKPHRSGDALGLYRYYACPQGLIEPAELPDGWGLLYITKGGIVQKKRQSIQFKNRDKEKEFRMMTSALSSPWKLFQHWTDYTIQRLAGVRWMSQTMGADLKLFCSRLAVNRLIESESDSIISNAKNSLFSLYENDNISAKDFNAFRALLEICDQPKHNQQLHPQTTLGDSI